MPAEYLLSVDLGTSHTVAVVVWPDGRTRPLLFDGSPVMPSAVFLDEAGTIHVGRDAVRLGPTAPERFEPNPKQRVGDGTLLLGDREIPVTSAFAAILTRVAQQAVEAIGGLPNTVLTCPAAWGEQRRAALHDAAAKAGYAPVQIVTEPVAAAHYYTGRLSHPIDPGQALAVFDFGGGTLDVAVVERRGDGSFGMLADGGLSDLGGLDFDAALVAHIGETVKQRDPELWKRLEQPATATDMRDRRTLWDDVRGAKEMLSRSSVAPVTVPGLEQALHLTRGELDQLARPLLSRAVGETQRVIGLTGRSPDQLTGLFLVGGSSRMPLVSKVLHEQLGFAPTVLEQPELPVSEGAAVAVSGPAPVTPPPSMSPPQPQPQSPQTGAYQPGSLPPQTPTPDATVGLPLPGGGPKRPRRRGKIIAIAAAVAAVAIAAPLAWMYFTDPYKQRDFIDLTEVADPIPYAVEEDRGDFYRVRVTDDRTLFAYTVGSGDEEELHLQAVRNETGEALWDEEKVIFGEGWDSVYAEDGIIALNQETDNDYNWFFLDWDDGETLEIHRAASGGAQSTGGDYLISAWEGGSSIDVYNAEGGRVADWDFGEQTITEWSVVETSEVLVNGQQPINGDGRIWAVTDDGVVHILDIDSGEELISEQVERAEDEYFAYDGVLYVASPNETGYRLLTYEIGDDELSAAGSVRVRDGDVSPAWIEPCGEGRVCVNEEIAGSDRSTFRVYDASGDDWAHEFDEGEYWGVTAVGDRLMVRQYEGEDLRTQVYDKDFEPVGESKVEYFRDIDGGSALSWPTWDGYGSLNEDQVVGLGVRDGSRTLLRDALAMYYCQPSDTYLACFVEEGMQVFRFREG
ncbi:Hsp70 family protein [Glycomyces xiaoerkulensis]|uniref:Hsp70 family protein n=1 Tax=Glycomyces xiaoerkulensis TaxID=2038139 RepID=UPI000C268035|nr:Hsp70 family protein [Glycomyces xiaoerkulensis]